MDADKLLQKLKDWRRKRADAEGVAAFLVFSNKVLESIASFKPKNEEELMAIKGIRDRKLAKYGDEILALVRNNEGIKEPPILEKNQSQNDRDLIVAMQNRFQIIITVAIFFPIVLDYFYRIYNKAAGDKIVLGYMLPAALYLFSYVAFEFCKSKIKNNFLRYLGIIILIGIAIFAISIFYIVNADSLQSNIHLANRINIIIYAISISGLFIIPSALIGLTIIFCLLSSEKRK